MIRIIFTLLAVGILGCSAPKNYYYFDDVKSNPPKASPSIASPDHELIEQTPLRIEPEALSASLEVTPVLAKEDKPADPGISGSAIKPEVIPATPAMTKREVRKELKQAIKSVRKSESVKDVKATAEKKNASKNGFAIAGFVLSLVSLFALWPLAILGVIFSAIGLKSEKRGLAIAGLVIGIVALTLVLIAGATLAAA